MRVALPSDARFEMVDAQSWLQVGVFLWSNYQIQHQAAQLDLPRRLVDDV